MRSFLAYSLMISLASSSIAGGTYLTVECEPSKKPGELAFGVTYTLWLPENAKTIRGVIVHQHGCGAGACKGGETAAYDLHWQALAAKWDCALLGPSYHQKDGENCQLWCDPRNGSRTTFLKALDDFAVKSQHPELAKAPWCLWGHSGGGMWASIMMASDPDRIAAAWLRSGTAFGRKDKGPAIEYPEAAYRIPAMANPGALEKDDKRFGSLYDACVAMQRHFRSKGAPFGLAIDPKSGHDCGESRYLAIPYFDVCLAARLPKTAGEPLRMIDDKTGWLALPSSDKAVPFAEYSNKPEEANWLPSEAVAKAWMEYVKAGVVSDRTPPPAPMNVTLKAGLLTWEASADFESGLQGFVILRDGAEVGRLPLKPNAKQLRPLFQGRSYHDTPEANRPKMEYQDAKDGKYEVIAVNGASLKSPAVVAK